MVARICTAAKVLVLAVLLTAAHAAPGKAGYEEGEAAYARGDYAAALEELEPLALQGDARAQFRLGVMYQPMSDALWSSSHDERTRQWPTRSLSI